MSNLPQQADLIMDTKHALDIILEHGLVNGLQGELPLARRVHDLIYLSKVAFTDDVTDVVLALQVLEHAEILQELEPSLDGIGLHDGGILRISSCQNQALVLEPDDNALLKVETGAAVPTKLAAKDHSLSGSLQRDQVDLTILDVDHLTLLVELVIG